MVKKSILAKVGDKVNYKLIRDGYKTGKGNVVVTAEMDTKSTITADVPSTAYTSNLDYEVDISGENPPIINVKSDITCPDDTVINKGKYLFYGIGQEYKIKGDTDIVDENFDKVGNVSVDSNGIASNFSTSNYIKMNTYLPSTYDIIIKYKHLSNDSQNELIANPTTDNSLYVFYDSNSSKSAITLYKSGNNDTYTNSNKMSFEIGNWYWVRTIFDGSEIKVYVLKDNNYSVSSLPELSNWQHEITKSASSWWSNMYLTIGANIPYSKSNSGEIDLKGFQIKSNDKVVWEAVETGEYVQGIKDYTLNDDGTELTTKLFDYHYREDVPMKINVSKVGSCVIDENGIASNFSNNSYVTFGKLNVDNNPWEMVFKVKYKEHSGFQRFCGSSSDDPKNLLIAAEDADKLSLYLSTNGSNWSISRTSSKTTLVNDTTYYIKVTFNGTNYILSLSTDGINYIEEINEASTTPMYNGVSTNFQIGCAFSGDSTYNWQGTIDLKESYVQIGDTEKKYFVEKPRLNDKASLYINPEKDNNLYYEKDELQLNVSKVGSCSIDKKGVASNFGQNSYVTPGPINFGAGTWEILFKSKYFSNNTNGRNICGSYDNSHMQIQIYVQGGDKKISMGLSSDGSNKDICNDMSGTTKLVNDTTYYIKVTFNGTNYILSLSTDGINYIEEINVASTTVLFNSKTNLWIGQSFVNNESAYAWGGNIDLKESYIQIGTDEKKYFAETIKKRYHIPSLYSEFIDNITIPAHALYDYIDGEWKLSSTSPFITQDITVNADNAEITMKEIEE